MANPRGTMGIVVGGGPAPGINSVIGAATIEAREQGYRVLGLIQGFQHLMLGDTSQVMELDISNVSRIHFLGGSILKTSRANPAKSETAMKNVVHGLEKLGITHLIAIGGDDTAFSAAEVSKAMGGRIHIAHIPKTIDNDLPLPGGFYTFGYQTAWHLGTMLVRNLMEDSLTTGRWYVIVTMGRKAGHLAQAIGLSSGATLTLIPEEFERGVTMREVCDHLECAIIKRMAQGRKDGVAIIAEGICEGFEPEELEALEGTHIERDPHGHIRLAEVDMAGMLRKSLSRRIKKRGLGITVVEKELGYELRCAPPTPFDISYTRSLGYNAVQHLAALPRDRASEPVMICMVGGDLERVKLEDMRLPETQRMAVRLVDTASPLTRVARNYMIRFTRQDLEDTELLDKMARLCGMSREEFVERFGYAAID